VTVPLLSPYARTPRDDALPCPFLPCPALPCPRQSQVVLIRRSHSRAHGCACCRARCSKLETDGDEADFGADEQEHDAVVRR
jgi:hypothetical protein